jgi:dolichyl-phosphate beta-glucosyltransferase
VQFPFLSVVIPCFNESERIDLMMSTLHQFLPQWEGRLEVILVNDGSTDNTSLKIKEHPFYSEKKFRLFEQENTGKGGALQLGVLNSSGEFILTLDADMATSPDELLHWIKDRGEFREDEILIGSREKNQTIVRDKPHRKFIGHCFNFLIRRITGLQISDTQCGFKLYPGVLGRELFQQLQTPGWAHDVEILVRASKRKIPIIEMPLHWQAMEGSKIRVLRDSWAMFWEVVRIRRKVV